MASLKEKSESILNDKRLNLLPENIKKDVTILGVTGTYDINSGIKLFKTNEEMQADTAAKTDDLAVVYGDEIKNMSADIEAQYLIFPETVVLTEAFTDFLSARFVSVDVTTMFDGNIQLDQNMFRFDGFTDTGMIRVSYNSSDGITYTREEFSSDTGDLTNPVNLGTKIKYNNEGGMTPWNDNLGYFMQVGGKVFGGLFKYGEYIDPGISLPDYSTLKYERNNISMTMSDIVISPEDIEKIIKPIKKDKFLEYKIAYDGVSNYYVLPCISNSSVTGLYYDTSTSKLYFLSIYNKDSSFVFEVPAVVYVVNNDYSLTSTIKLTDLSEIIYKTTFSSYTRTYYKIVELNLTNKTFIVNASVNGNEISIQNEDISYNSGIGENVNSVKNYNIDSTHAKKSKYLSADNQFTALSENVFNSIAYGKDGVINGNLANDVSTIFTDINAEAYAKLQLSYNDMEPRVLTNSDKELNRNLYVVPIKLDGTPLLDTSQLTNCGGLFQNSQNLISVPMLDISNATDIAYMFGDCTNLIYIPVLNTSKVVDMLGTFTRCPKLSDKSLNNILQMCINASNYRENKTLEYLGLSEEQATKCTTLSNYEAFTEAGWTTGY